MKQTEKKKIAHTRRRNLLKKEEKAAKKAWHMNTPGLPFINNLMQRSAAAWKMSTERHPLVAAIPSRIAPLLR